MRGFNKAIIMGNLVRDPELKRTRDSRSVASFTVAVNRVWKDQAGQNQEETDYLPVVVWGAVAEFCQKYFHKGDSILLEGRISVRSYETKSGEKRYATEIVASTVQFAGYSKQQNGTQSNYQGQNKHSSQNNRNSYTPQEFAEKTPVQDLDILPF